MAAVEDSTTDPIIREIRERRDIAEHEWAEIRAEAKKDRLCVAGKTWEALDPDGRKKRDDVKRPYLNLDELNQYLNQHVNNVRANPRGAKFTPTGNGANDATAEFYEGYVRECEYRSHAHIVDSNAFDNAATGGMGWERITYRRESPRSLNSELYIELVANPDQVLPDPSIVWPDARDMEWLQYLEPWPRSEFVRKFGKKAKTVDFTSGLMALAPSWVQENHIVVAEDWTLKKITRLLVVFKSPNDGQLVHLFDDELTKELIALLPQLRADTENFREEDVEDQAVTMRLTNGLDILETTNWPGRYIPFASCMGKVLYTHEGAGTKRTVLSLVRHPRSAQMLHNYIVTCKAEALGGIPRSNWVGWEGSFANPDEWTKASREPVDHLEVKMEVDGKPVPGLPERQPWAPEIQSLEIADQSAIRSIQAAFGVMPVNATAEREIQASGRAMDRRQALEQKGSYHIVDSYELMIERRAVILEDLITHVVDTPRDVVIRKPDQTTESVRVNDPNVETPIWTDTDHRVTISTGPATESQRVEGSEFVDQLAANLQTIAQLAGPQVALQVLAESIKLKQLGPTGDVIVKLLAPPQTGEDGKPVDPKYAALMQQVKQLQQQVQQAGQVIQGKQVEKQAEQQGKMAIVQVQEQHEDARAHESNEVKLFTADINAKMDKLAILVDGLTQIHERFLGESQRQHEHVEATRDRVHESIESAKDRLHDRAMADVAHQQVLEAGAQGIDGQMAVQDNAPQPEQAA